jgi:hypothetical protein
MQLYEVKGQLFEIITHLQKNEEKIQNLHEYTHISGDSANSAHLLIITYNKTAKSIQNVMREKEILPFVEELFEKNKFLTGKERQFHPFVNFVASDPQNKKLVGEVLNYTKRILASLMLTRWIDNNMAYQFFDITNPDIACFVVETDELWISILQTMRMREAGLIFTLEEKIQEKIGEIEVKIKPKTPGICPEKLPSSAFFPSSKFKPRNPILQLDSEKKIPLRLSKSKPPAIGCIDMTEPVRVELEKKTNEEPKFKQTVEKNPFFSSNINKGQNLNPISPHNHSTQTNSTAIPQISSNNTNTSKSPKLETIQNELKILKKDKEDEDMADILVQLKKTAEILEDKRDGSE